MNLEKIFSSFRAPGTFQKARRYGSGHINDASLVTCSDGWAQHRCLLQRINHHVFPNPPELMENALKVTAHLHEKLRRDGAEDIDRKVMTFYPAYDGCPYVRDEEGGYWRLCRFIEDTVTYDSIDRPRLAFEAARMFGWFQMMLADLPVDQLHETIPDFHNTLRRLDAFLAILEKDPQNRAAAVKPEIEFALWHQSNASLLADLQRQGTVPLRIVHNDTKINNVLFDTRTDTGVCVVDLDTVMPGVSLYDFGDMVRTAACTAAEDERDLTKVSIDPILFESLVRGYAQQVARMLNETEQNSLVAAGKVIIFEQMLRFLADYLAGDVYYKTHRPSHNLDRTRTQMKLLISLIEQEEKLYDCTQRLWS